MHQLFRVNPHRDYGDSEIQSPCIDLLCHKLSGHFMSYHMRSTEHVDVASKHLMPVVMYSVTFFFTFFLSPIYVSYAEKVNPRWLQLNLFFLLLLVTPLST
jgi:hypothetical protein